jgi:hypothetical protein
MCEHPAPRALRYDCTMTMRAPPHGWRRRLRSAAQRTRARMADASALLFAVRRPPPWEAQKCYNNASAHPESFFL